MPRIDNCRRAGFTLIEILVALAVASLVMLAAHDFLTTVADSVGRLPRVADSASRARNRERELRELVLRADIGQDSTEVFVGAHDSTRFDSRCISAGGWLERCSVVLRLDQRADSVAVDLIVDGNVAVMLTRAGTGRIDYLRVAGGDGLWNGRWGTAHTLPLAVRVTAGDSVIILRVGEHG